MLSLIKKAYRHLLDTELGVLGDDLNLIAERLRDHQLAIMRLGERFERLQSRAGMHALRESRRGEPRSQPIDTQDAAAEFDELRRQEAQGGFVDINTIAANQRRR